MAVPINHQISVRPFKAALRAFIDCDVLSFVLCADDGSFAAFRALERDAATVVRNRVAEIALDCHMAREMGFV